MRDGIVVGGVERSGWMDRYSAIGLVDLGSIPTTTNGGDHVDDHCCELRLVVSDVYA